MTSDQPISSSDKFRTWDWEFCRATRTDSNTKSLFEYAEIVAHRDDVLRTWPSVEMTMNTPGSEVLDEIFSRHDLSRKKQRENAKERYPEVTEKELRAAESKYPRKQGPQPKRISA
jgi:hypothetical protein